MLTESTLNKIQLLYKKYLNDITLFPDEDLKLLMFYFSEHSLFTDILKTKGFTVFKKILTNIRLKQCERHDTMVKFDSNKNVFNILLLGNIKKRNLFKGMRKEQAKKNSGKYLYCVYHCLSNCLFAEMDRHVYMKYLVSSASDLYDRFIEKISKFSFLGKLSDYQYNKLFLNYVEKKYGSHEIIYNEGDTVDGIYLIMKGKCQILKKKNNNLILDQIKNTNNNIIWNNNFLTITDDDIKENNEREKNSKSFHPIFAKCNKNNNILLTMTVGDIFGDLEINMNNNKREFSVKCGNYDKTKIWFFPLEIIKNIINNCKEISMQKYEIIKTRFEYVNMIDKVKKENTIYKNEIKINELINNSKIMNSNFKPFQNSININALKSSSDNKNILKEFKDRNLINNISLIPSRNNILKRKSRFINKNNFLSQSRPKLKILPYNSPVGRNLISITKENNYIKKVSSNILTMRSLHLPKFNQMNNLNLKEQKLFLNKVNKKGIKDFIQCSNNDTF